MTRRTLNADGTITLISFSFWGNGDADEALQMELAAIEKNNRQARSQWDSMTQEEREERTRDFENKRKARETLMAAAIEIPPHILGRKKNNRHQTQTLCLPD